MRLLPFLPLLHSHDHEVPKNSLGEGVKNTLSSFILTKAIYFASLLLIFCLYYRFPPHDVSMQQWQRCVWIHWFLVWKPPRLNAIQSNQSSHRPAFQVSILDLRVLNLNTILGSIFTKELLSSSPCWCCLVFIEGWQLWSLYLFIYSFIYFDTALSSAVTIDMSFYPVKRQNKLQHQIILGLRLFQNVSKLRCLEQFFEGSTVIALLQGVTVFRHELRKISLKLGMDIF